jgi:hypothetical protein
MWFAVRASVAVLAIALLFASLTAVVPVAGLEGVLLLCLLITVALVTRRCRRASRSTARTEAECQVACRESRQATRSRIGPRSYFGPPIPTVNRRVPTAYKASAPAA